MPKHTENDTLEFERIKLERLKVFSRIITVLISVGLGTLGVALINNSYQSRLLEQQQLQNEAQLELQRKQAEAARQQAEMKYLGEFIEYALEDDFEKRLRFAEYFAELSISSELKTQWKAYHDKLKQLWLELSKSEAQLAKAQIAGDSETVEKLETQVALMQRRLDKLEKPIEKVQQVESLTIREFVERGKTRVSVLDDKIEVLFTKFKKGIYTFGQQRALPFIETHKEALRSLGLTNSAINVMMALAENEANLDSVNTWDNSFLSFGMFQWTAGARSDPGELPALLQRIKASDPAIFEKYYGQYGLELVDTGAITGFFSLHGKKLSFPAAKERLRSHEWAFRFWLSGQDPEVQKFEVFHAFSRLGTFYTAEDYRAKDHYLSELITSEYGVALILDQHVNRPGYLKPCVAKAMEETGLLDPSSWGTDEERKLIDAYLRIRETYGRYPMTHARKRVAVTKKYLEDGAISDERGSFDNPLQ